MDRCEKCEFLTALVKQAHKRVHAVELRRPKVIGNRDLKIALGEERSAGRKALQELRDHIQTHGLRPEVIWTRPGVARMAAAGERAAAGVHAVKAASASSFS